VNVKTGLFPADNASVKNLGAPTGMPGFRAGNAWQAEVWCYSPRQPDMSMMNLKRLVQTGGES